RTWRHPRGWRAFGRFPWRPGIILYKCTASLREGLPTGSALRTSIAAPPPAQLQPPIWRRTCIPVDRGAGVVLEAVVPPERPPRLRARLQPAPRLPFGRQCGPPRTSEIVELAAAALVADHMPHRA